MKYSRTLRLAELIHREIAKILLQEIDDPLCKNITVIDVKVAPDLATAKIFISLMDENESTEAFKILNREAKKIRWLLAHKLNLRLTPKLNFIYDNSVIHGEKLQSLIDEAITKDQVLHDKAELQATDKNDK